MHTHNRQKYGIPPGKANRSSLAPVPGALPVSLVPSPGARAPRFAPGNSFFALPGAVAYLFAPGRPKTLPPGAGTRRFAPGSTFPCQTGPGGRNLCPGGPSASLHPSHRGPRWVPPVHKPRAATVRRAEAQSTGAGTCHFARGRPDYTMQNDKKHPKASLETLFFAFPNWR